MQTFGGLVTMLSVRGRPASVGEASQLGRSVSPQSSRESWIREKFFRRPAFLSEVDTSGPRPENRGHDRKNRVATLLGAAAESPRLKIFPRDTDGQRRRHTTFSASARADCQWFEEPYREHAGLLVAFLRRRVSSSSAIELSQRVWLKVWSKSASMPTAFDA